MWKTSTTKESRENAAGLSQDARTHACNSHFKTDERNKKDKLPAKRREHTYYNNQVYPTSGHDTPRACKTNITKIVEALAQQYPTDPMRLLLTM